MEKNEELQRTIVNPTTCPLLLTAQASLFPRLLPSAPRSTIPPVVVHEKAWSEPSPATWPLLFTA
jgi:hypothetical protein